MNITFFSNFLNSHQLPMALAFDAMVNVNYTFISLMETDHLVGRESLDRDYAFVLREYEGEQQKMDAMRHALEDEVVVFGDMSGKEQYVKARAGTGKHFFRYSERLLKRGDWWRFVPPKIYRTWNWFGRYKNANMHVLCASAYTARDLELFGFPREKCLKWGYFPDAEVCEASHIALPGYKTLCSAQRLIPWKRVDMQLRLAYRLKQEGYAFRLRIAGDGPERVRLEKIAHDLGVTECVEFLGELTHDETIELMRDSEIFLATSNRMEGWGATVNEAMASGCCVVASDAMGSVPYLIEDGVTGIIYKDGEDGDLFSRTALLFDGEVDVRFISSNAVIRLRDVWGASSAARALYNMSVFNRIPGSEDAGLNSNLPLSLA